MKELVLWIQAHPFTAILLLALLDFDWTNVVLLVLLLLLFG